MKIVHFITSLAYGGAESLVSDYAINQKNNGHEVAVIAIINIGETRNTEKLIKNNIKVYYLQDYLTGFTNKKFIRRLIMQHKLNFILEEIAPDIVHAHLEVLNYLQFIPQNSRYKLLYTCHSKPDYYFGTSNQKNLVNNLIHKKGMKIIALHSEAKSEIDSLFECRSYILPNGVDSRRFSCENAFREHTREELGLSDQDFLVGHIGRLTYAKNHEFLFRMFVAIRSVNKSARLLFIGSGEKKDDLFSELKRLDLMDSVIYIEHTDKPEKYLQAMDVFVMPSIFEGFPVVLLEAQFLGVPCVVADTITKDAIINKNARMLSLKDDISIWVKTVFDVVNIIDYKNITIREFDIAIINKRLEDIYIDVISIK